MLTRLSQSFSKNPLAWILFVLFLIAEGGNWQRGVELSRLCELTGLDDDLVANLTANQREIRRICVGRRPEERAD
ncbi:hypothetical protein [Reyranella sp.]|uniref:hypothetical protein n=1 Tax=Reyranella sp. TaxID=1929291 RepID=UPI003D12E790